MISTLLVSCVAICLNNTKKGYAGMNHYMLPTEDKMSMKIKYGDQAIPKLVEMMLKLDPDIKNLEAQIYGDGAVVGHLNTGEDIGKKNIEIADKLIAGY